MTVMVVDWNPQVRRVIEDVVGDLADVVCECATPLAALSDYRRFRPDLVVMDIGRPPRDGIWATRQIVGLHPEAVVVIITAYPDATFHAAAQEAGARGLVLKDNLLDLRQWLEAPHV
jgi:two-component system, chemotaxis family, chemotaxis protein CheY